MAFTTVNYSIPEELKEAFNAEFSSENKSAVIARLMQRALDERQLERRRAAAIDALLEFRRTQNPVSERDVATARRRGRP